MDTSALKQVFNQFGPTSSAQAMNLPSSLTMNMAKEAADKVDMAEMVPEIAIILASRLADVLIQQALRPADYADLREISDALVERLIERLAEKPEEFFAIFSQQLRSIG